jgi:hypothetical protein
MAKRPVGIGRSGNDMFKFKRHSPSSLNLFAAAPSLFVLEKIMGHRGSVGPAAYRGTAVESGVAHGLVNPDAPMADCIAIARDEFAKLASLSADPRKEKIEAEIPAMVEQAVDALRPYGVPDALQESHEWRPEGLKYPIFGYSDFLWNDSGIIVDLKTTGALPSKITPANARQVAFYCGENMQGRLAYVTPKKLAIYQLENVKEHRETVLRMAEACERFISLSDDPEFFRSIVVPDLSSFYWSAPDTRALAWKYWKI